jgi:hypothetical protein
VEPSGKVSTENVVGEAYREIVCSSSTMMFKPNLELLYVLECSYVGSLMQEG